MFSPIHKIVSFIRKACFFKFLLNFITKLYQILYRSGYLFLLQVPLVCRYFQVYTSLKQKRITSESLNVPGYDASAKK